MPDERRERAKILIVEDEAIVVLDLRRRLEALGYEICGEADSAADAVALASAVNPDLVLMDIVLQGDADGVDAATEILNHSRIPVVFLTAHSDPRTIERAKRVEPASYLVKPFDERELDAAIQLARYRYRTNPAAHLKSNDVAAIRGIAAEVSHRGQKLLTIVDAPVHSPAAAQSASPESGSGSARTRRLERPPVLAPREWEVARGLVSGQRLSDVADTLGISVHTARNHLRSVFRKLGVRSQADLMRVLLAPSPPQG